MTTRTESSPRPFKKCSTAERSGHLDQVAQMIKDGHLRPAKPLPDGRPDEGAEDSEPQDEGTDD